MSNFVDLNLEDETEAAEPLPESIQPTVSMQPKEVAELDNRFYDKCLRGPNDVVLSGPYLGHKGPGRVFRNSHAAKKYLVDKYGADRVKPLDRWTDGRWAFLIKNLKKEGVDVTA